MIRRQHAVKTPLMLRRNHHNRSYDDPMRLFKGFWVVFDAVSDGEDTGNGHAMEILQRVELASSVLLFRETNRVLAVKIGSGPTFISCCLALRAMQSETKSFWKPWT